MYVAKARGRNQAVIFDDDLREAVNERTSLELLLREAIEGDGLRLHYQPEVDLRTGRLLSVEALVRWQHPRAASSRRPISSRSPRRPVS